MHPSRQISRGLLLRAKAAPLQASRHAFFNSLLGLKHLGYREHFAHGRTVRQVPEGRS